MTQHSQQDFGMDVKGKVLLQLFNKRKPNFSLIYSQIKKIGFNAPLNKI